MNNWHPDTTVLIQSLGWALCHSIWQGLLILCLVRLLFKMIPSRHASARYNIALAGLAAIPLLFADTWMQYWHRLQGIAITITETQGGQALSSRTITTLPDNAVMLQSNAAGFFERLEAWFPLMVGIYAIGLAFLAIRFCIRFLHIGQLRRAGTIQPAAALLERLNFHKQQLNITRNIGLVLSEKINVPMMIGTIKPLILLPMASVSMLSPDQLEAILLHELAHIKRQDYLINLLQTIVETFLFFNPAVWLLSADIRREREHCCDDMVMAHTYPLSYARALAMLESARIMPAKLAMGASGASKNQLLNRIKRIMEPNQKTNNNSLPVVLTIVAGIALILTVCFSPSLAQSKKDKKKATTQKQTTTKSVKYTVIDSNGKRHYSSLEDMPEDERALLTDIPEPPINDIDTLDVERLVKDLPEVPDVPEVPNPGRIIEEVMTSMNWEEIGDQVSTAMASVDWDAIDRDIQKSMKEIDQSIKEIDATRIDTEISGHMDSATRARVRAAMDMARAESRKAMIESRKAMIESRKAFAESRKAANESRKAEFASRAAEMKSRSVRASSPYERMLNRMQEDGLINREKAFKIEKKNSKLYINGEQQPEKVYSKYGHYLDGDKAKIEGDKDRLKIDIRN